MSPIKILAIEDDEFMRIFLKDVFAIHDDDFKTEYYAAPCLEVGEKMFKELSPDLIFLDIALPLKLGDRPQKELGFKFLERVKKENSEVKVIVFSGYKEKSLQEKARQLGADRYLVKGEYLPKELIGAVKEIVTAVKK